MRKSKNSKLKSQKLKGKKENGFTLVELLVATSIFMIVVTIVLSVTLTVVQSNNKARMINRIRDTGSRIIEEMERDIKSSDLVSTSVNGDELNFRQNGSAYYQYKVVTSESENNYIEKFSCTGLGVVCTTELYLLTPTDIKTGVNVKSPETNFTYKEHGEVELTIALEQPKAVPDKPDYQAEVILRSSVALRNY